MTFKAGDFVWWRVRGRAYGYLDRVQAVVHGMSKSGKRALIKFQNQSREAGPLGDTFRYVPPGNLETRS